MKQWRSWDLEEWNSLLIQHFFTCSDDASDPVVVLLVTADQLAIAVDEPIEHGEQVRDAFVEAVRTEIRRSAGLLEDAAGYPEWPLRPKASSPAPFVAHLLFTCVAASESSDELRDEASFISRLRELTGNQLPDHSLQMLPRLWERFVEWLEATPRKYRQLILPAPGPLTRIGYTVRLSFPDRRDQKVLSELLDAVGLMGQEPPVGRVLALVASHRHRFRRPFLEALEEFRNLFASSEALATPTLLRHRFWAAVREAALRGRGQSQAVGTKTNLSLLAEEQEDGLSIFAVSDHKPDGATGFYQLPFPYGPWRYAISHGTAPAAAVELESTSRAILAGTLTLPKLSSIVDQGVLPFAVGPHGLLELAAFDQLNDASVALVRDALVPDLIKFFGVQPAAIKRSSYDGWTEIYEPKLHSVSSEKLASTSLDKTWLLHETLRPVSPRPIRGIRTDDGWLGILEVLPQIVAHGASAVTLAGTSGEVSLEPVGSGRWLLPAEDLEGEFTIVASRDDSANRSSIRFNCTPASESFKPASEPTAWITEGVAGTDTLGAQVPFRSSPAETDCEPFCDRTAYLGADVGRFTNSSASAAWRVSRFAGRLFGSAGTLRGEAATPANQVDDPHARRLWRKMLFESAPWLDSEFAERRRRVRSLASGSAHLPRLQCEQHIPDLAALPLPHVSERTDRLVRIIAGRASMRAGIDWTEWAALAQRVLDVDRRALDFVTRAWAEAGCFDIASSARWRHRVIFARQPRLIAFKFGESVGAVLSGLALPATLNEIRRNADITGAFVEDRLSVSPLVPSTLAFRAASLSILEDLSRRNGLELRWLDLESLSDAPIRHDGLSPPPHGYDRVTQWHRWSLQPAENPDVSFEHHMRPSRPDYWVISTTDKRVWSFDLNIARIWAASILGEPIVNRASDTLLEAGHAFLPLPLARAVSVLGSALPGPQGNRYFYAVASPRLRQYVLEALARAFDVSRLAVSTAERSNG